VVPHTYPSTINSVTNKRQMVVYFLSSVSGLERWKDYIPVKFITSVTRKEGSFDNEGYIAVDSLTDLTGKQAWVDYIPVYLDNSATTSWQVNSVGFIQIGLSGQVDPKFVNQYLSITDSEAFPDDTFFAENSVNGGNNTGWTFL
jgi:hypothetical protein